MMKGYKERNLKEGILEYKESTGIRDLLPKTNEAEKGDQVEQSRIEEKVVKDQIKSPIKSPAKPKLINTKKPKVGDRIKVYWDKSSAGSEEKAGWYEGTVVKESTSNRFGSHEILYDDMKEKGDNEAVIERLTSKSGNAQWEMIDHMTADKGES